MKETDLFKVLGNPERYAILRRLMALQATLSQLGVFFEKSPAHIRHHLKLLEQAGLVEFVEARAVQGGPEKYYRATQQALFIHHAVLPEIPQERVSISIGSMDSGISYLADQLSRGKTGINLLPVPLSSLDGLIALRQGLCQMSTCHLIDLDSEEYNRPVIRRLFPGQPMALIQVYRREEGILVRPGNPSGIRGIEDLMRPDLRFVNRETGSGVRQWLDRQIKRLGIQPEMVPGYGSVVRSHSEVARSVRDGKADLGIGIAAVAGKFGLEYIPLFEEPYEIAVSPDDISDNRYAPFFEYLSSGEFRTTVNALDGYLIPQNSGEIEMVLS